MKKTVAKIGAMLLISLVMVSCAQTESEKEKDAKRVAEMACELRTIAVGGEDSFEDFSNLTLKMEEYRNLMKELEGKYENLAEDEEFEEMIRAALKDTPCKDVELENIFDFL